MWVNEGMTIPDIGICILGGSLEPAVALLSAAAAAAATAAFAALTLIGDGAAVWLPPQRVPPSV
jgi:hypothetical protein